MSLVSQIQAKGRTPGFAPRFLVAMAAVVVVLYLALGAFWRPALGGLAAARLHAPDLTVWNGLSPAIKVHVLFAVAALVLGAVLMLVRKGRTFHRVAGWTWVAVVAVVAGSTLFITSLNHGSWSVLHLFTGWTLITLPIAVIAARRHEIARHRGRMMGLFYGGFAINLFVAFIPGRALWQMFFG
ncbi:DUF2306 domain-containing protein [Phenylobacterium sp.]|jgi:uncharacterized membrane protein|uniref:DUF2306 domain-containing protein n=1 Tax=Phenylobacterium sp. TaxID=1871053 RepID=UPI002F95CC2E